MTALLALEQGQGVVAVQAGDEGEVDVLGADRFAGAGDGALGGVYDQLGRRIDYKPVTLFPAEIQPGQYVAFTVNLPVVSLYDARRQILRDLHIRHRNSLPGVPRASLSR